MIGFLPQRATRGGELGLPAYHLILKEIVKIHVVAQESIAQLDKAVLEVVKVLRDLRGYLLHPERGLGEEVEYLAPPHRLK